MQKTDRTGDADSPREWLAAGRRLSEETAILLAVFAVGLVALVLAYRPLGTPAIGFDSAASVLYFDRIAAHQPLEAWVSTTPKPFVTLLYGIVFNLAHDWRALSVLATLEYAVMLAAAAALALRTGGLVAAGMTASGLLGSYLLFEDGSLTYATPWAILFWAVAGLALTARSPRFGLAGIALFLGALARVETFIILGLAAVALGVWRFAPAELLADIPRPPRRAALLLLGFLALPVMILHDWLLTGNGFFWVDVSTIVSKAVPAAVMSPTQLASTLVDHFAGNWARLVLLGLCAVGVVDLLRRRQAVVLIGLAACGPGVIAFLEFLAIRNTYVSGRYVIPADAAVVFGAAVGAQALVTLAIAAARRAGPSLVVRAPISSTSTSLRIRLVAAGGWVVVGALVAVALIRPYGPISQDTRGTVSGSIALQADVQLALPTISAAMDALPDRPAWILTDVERPNQGPPPRLWVPALLVPNVAVDMGLPVWSVRGGSPIGGDPSILTVTVSTIVYVDRDHGGNAAQDDAPFEVDHAVRVGRTTVTPLLSLPDRGLWVVRLSPVGA